jgi:transposase
MHLLVGVDPDGDLQVPGDVCHGGRVILLDATDGWSHRPGGRTTLRRVCGDRLLSGHTARSVPLVAAAASSRQVLNQAPSRWGQGSDPCHDRHDNSRWPRLEPTGRLQGTKPVGGRVRRSPQPPSGSSQWGDHVGANPVDRGKPGSKLHLVCDGGGLPLTVVVTAANAGDTTIFQAVVDDVPPIRTPSGRRRTRPGKVHADKGYDSAANRAYLRRRGIRPRIARRGVESSSKLGRHRWKVERSLSWLSCWRRLGVRWDRDSGRWFAFVLVACAVVCFNRL